MKGFTILEVLLSLALIGLIFTISAPVIFSLQSRNDLDVAAAEIVQTLRRAQVLAHGMDGDTSWGVRAQQGNITLFKGTNYAVRDANFDETFDVPRGINFSGLQEVVFLKFSGEPQDAGNMILTDPANETRTISINTKGLVNY